MSLLLMGAVNLLSYQNATRLIDSSAKVRQTNEVLKTLNGISTTLTEAEVGRRGYILLADQAELDRYYQSVQRVNSNLERLKQQVAEKPKQQQYLAILKSLIAQRLALAERSLDLYESGGTPAATQVSLVVQNNRSRSEIHRVIDQMRSNEEQSLEGWIAQFQSSTRNRLWLEFLIIVVSFAILIGLYRLLHHQMVKRQQAETVQRILAQEKELGELKLRFFSMVSHEFRTPLSVILGSAQLLSESDQQRTGDKKQKNLDRIQASAKLMNQLLTDILTLTRAEAGKLEYNPELLDVESFCLNLVESIQLSTDKSHQIQFVSDGSCTYRKLDEKLLYSILSNLLSNAIKYSPQGGMVQFRLICESGDTIFQVKDQGIGISSADQQRLYEPFHRSKNVDDIVGSGLGLAVVKKCVDLHQGEISVESKEEVGTTFTVRIPIATTAKRSPIAVING